MKKDSNEMSKFGSTNGKSHTSSIGTMSQRFKFKQPHQQKQFSSAI